MSKKNSLKGHLCIRKEEMEKNIIGGIDKQKRSKSKQGKKKGRKKKKRIINDKV